MKRLAPILAPKRAAIVAPILTLFLAGLALLAGCPPPGDNPCVKARAKLCGEGSPMREGGICARLRSDGDHPDADLSKKCETLLDEMK